MRFQQHLSPAQQEAVRYVLSPTIVTAGAGSGKTRTLTSKIAHLVNDLGYDPAKILAITFTNKAAEEMKDRLANTTGRPVDDFPWVRTFHSACFRILKAHCDLLGYCKPLLIHAESHQRTHLKKVLAEFDLDRKYLYGAGSMISHAKNSGDARQYLQAHGKLPRKMEIYRRYNELLEQNNSVDFDDILLLTRDLLKKFPEIRSAYQEQFDYILVDEFQDSNAIQNEIVDLLLKDGRLTVVGDDYQSIYKFRGADPAHFINFPRKYSGAQVFKLEENYRSTAQIVAASDELIAHNAARMEKKCFSRREGELIGVKLLMDERSEAGWIAEKCWEYANYKKIPRHQMAVLFRTKFASLPLERAFRAAQIPYVMVGAQAFFLRREVQDINAYLVCAINDRDDVSFERIMNVPRRGIGAGALNKILAVREPEMTLRQACRKAVSNKLLPQKTAATLDKLLTFLESLREHKPDTAMLRVIDETGYEEHVRGFAENEDDFTTRMENLRQMVFDASHKATIAEYVEDAALIRDDQDTAENNKNAVRLSTIHAAKGLEFKVVFVVGLEEGMLPHHRSLGLEQEADNDEGLQEERRLMYVAMTRASDLLHLTYTMMRKGEPTQPSRFLDEIPKDLLQGE